jgi:hypothetical protein
VLAVFAAAVMTLVIAAREARSSDPASDPPIEGTTGAVPAANAPPGSVFWGCWTMFSSGPCRAVYQDTAGNFLLCGECGPGGQPNPKGCSATSSQALDRGFWCS